MKKQPGNLQKFIPFLIIWLFLSGSSTLLAENFKESDYNKRIFSVNQGYIFSGNGDKWGISNEFSQVKTISSRFFHRESVQGWIINGSSWINKGFENQTGIGLGAEMGFSILKMKKRIAYLSVGGTLAYLSNISPYFGSSSEYNYNGYTRSIGSTDYAAENTITPGFMLSAGYITKVNEHIYLNLKVHTKVYKTGDIMSTLSVGIGLNAIKKTNSSK